MSRLIKTSVTRSKTSLLIFLLGTCYSCICQVSAAEQDPDSTDNPWQWLEGRRNLVSENVTALAQNLDAWLAGETIEEQANASSLNIRLNQQLGSFDGYHSKLKIGGSLDLPLASERWKLIFESDPEELNSLQDNVLGNTNSSESVAGFRYLQNIGDSLVLRYDIGLRARLPVDPFFRIRAKYRRQLGTTWSLGLSQKIWYYQSDGWGYDTDISFTREFGARNILRVASEVKYQQNDKETEFSQSVMLHRTLGELETLSYGLGLLGTNAPNIRVDDYYVEARYRRAILDNWLFVEVVPQVLVSRDESWRPQPRLLFNLEVMFFDLPR